MNQEVVAVTNDLDARTENQLGSHIPLIKTHRSATFV